ncbi:bifunctional sulfate adenylyltransferase/adenylylsulfate kinase [Calderihabitans maritimus]|uniref:bifunctional sulfate adenylyltransferase/adenylylsulfate kinase n=1 Tax=Calderihabitans maritimus TaxID=1246530 RepID=UPI0034D2B6E9
MVSKQVPAEPNPPYGGVLKELIAEQSRIAELKKEAVYLPSWDLTQRQLCDLELLLCGAFSPLEGFLCRDDYEAVCRQMRLTDGTLWPIPVTLDVTEQFASSLDKGDKIALRHPEGMVLAVMTVEDVWKPDLHAEAECVYGTADEAHPGVFQLFRQTNPVYVGGSLEGLELPVHHTFKKLRHTPAELRNIFKSLGWARVVGFQTRNPMHKAHVELTRRAMEEAGASLLIHPVVGRTSPGDIDYFTRARCYQRIMKYYPEQSAMLSLLPLAMRMAGPREALWHAIIRKNYGCTHFIIGRDHAGPRRTDNGEAFYPPYAARDLARKHEDELGITILTYEEMVYVADFDRYMMRSELPEKARFLTLSGTELRRRLREGLPIPDWFSYPEVINELRRAYPPRAEQGFTVFFTGLSGAGKSTIAQILMAKLMEDGHRRVTLLDGDIVRKHLSSELGFSKRDRDLNIKRIGFVASEITKNGGVAICAPIAPYRATRREVREMVSQHGGFIEVYVATPLEVCEARDRKGLYAKARAGLITNFTGIDDPYEPPENAEVVVDTSRISAEEAANQILSYLESQGYIGNQG